MKEFSKENIIIDKNINVVFELLYNQNENLLSNMFNLPEYNKGEWKDNKRTDIAVIIFQDMPEILCTTFLNNNKEIKMECKNKILKNTSDERNVVTKFKIIDNSKLLKLANILKLINIKNNINLKYINENQTMISVSTKIKTYILPPYNEILEIFSISMCTKILEDSINTLSI